MKLNTKVLVVGGGPAGATAGRLLAESGKEIILLEGNLSYDKPCGGGIALNTFDEFSLSETSVKREVHGLRIVSPRGNRVEIDLQDHGLAIVGRKEFDKALRQRAEAQGARIIEGKFLRVLDDKKCRVEALLGQEKVEIVSEYIIAADGVNSRVRTSLGIKPLPTLLTISERVPGPDLDYCEFWWKGRFQKRFILLDKLNTYFSKNNNSAEKLIAWHRRPEVQEASLLLWLRKDKSRQSLLHYLKLFGKFLH